VDAGATSIAAGTDPLGARFTLTLRHYVPRAEGERCDPTGLDEPARCAAGLACASERGGAHCRAIDAGCGMGATVVELELSGDHARVTGDAAGGTSEYQPVCSGEVQARGQEVAHRLVLPHDAIVSAELGVGPGWRAARPSVVIATSCRDRLETEGCGLGLPGRAASARSAPLRAGTEVFVIVDSSASMVVAPYELDVRLLPVGALDAACGEGCAPGLSCVEGTCRAACGDGTAQPGEACDDGGLAPGDGCDASCRVEPEAALGGCTEPRRLGLRRGPGGSRVAMAEGDTTGAPPGDPSSCGGDAMPQHAFVLELDEPSDVRVWLDPEAGYDALLVAVGSTCGATPRDRACSDTYASESLELAGLAAGTHHILVTGYSPSFAPRSAGRYRLRVEVTPTAP
jgi:cysteine-rich repeat protein